MAAGAACFRIMRVAVACILPSIWCVARKVVAVSASCWYFSEYGMVFPFGRCPQWVLVHLFLCWKRIACFQREEAPTECSQARLSFGGPLGGMALPVSSMIQVGRALLGQRVHGDGREGLHVFVDGLF